jgi:DNA-binding MarR family transcriptional regulator
MTDQKTQLNVLKAIIKADLTKAEIKVTTHFLANSDTKFTANTTILSAATGLTTSNVKRTLDTLESKNIIAYRESTKNIYVKSITKWGAKKKTK